jgi:hypothetical protein
MSKGQRRVVRLSFLLPVLGLCLAAMPATAQQLPGKHPALLHALTDLRTARWFLMRQPGNWKVYADEDVAITELEAAIADIKKAAIDDGKDINDHPAEDVKEHGSRLLKSIEALDGAQRDVNQEEDNPTVHGLRSRSLDHIHKAHDAATRAHAQWLKEGAPK